MSEQKQHMIYPAQDKKEQDPASGHTSAEEQYEWSFIRVSEQITINVVSAFIIAIGGIILATLWQGGSLLLQSLLHVPAELSGILAFVLLGMLLMLLLIVLFIRGLSPGMAVGLLVGAVLGMSLGALLETQTKKPASKHSDKQ